MILSLRFARKAAASLLAAILFICAPGPFALSAFAQTIGRVGTPAGAGNSVAIPLSGPSAVSAPSLTVPALPASSLSAPPAPTPAAATPEKPATAIAAATALGARLQAARIGESSAQVAPALSAFYAGSAAATPDESAPAVAPGQWGSSSERIGFSYSGFRYRLRRSFASSFRVLNRYYQWYDLPPLLGQINLAAIETRMRLDNLHNPAAYAANAHQTIAAPTRAQIETQDPSGRYHDLKDPGMGAAGARFGRLSEPVKHGSDVSPALMERMGRISEILFKRTKFVPALILNNHAAFWIQAMVHDWMNHKRKPVAENPYKVPLPAGHPMNGTEMILDRTAGDETRAPGAQPPTFENTETHWWDLSMVYGSSPETLAGLRAPGGKMIVEPDGRLPEDPSHPGVDKTGFNTNYSVGLAILHTILVKEHNAIVDALKATYPSWDDEKLFRQARLINVAFAAKVHTVEWTRALLPNRTLHIAMWADWYGFIGKRLKLWLMRRVYSRHPLLARLLHPIRSHEWISGVPGTTVEHLTAPFAMPEEFVEVYRLHSLLPDDYEISSLLSRKLLAHLSLTEIQGKYTRGVTEKFSWTDLIASFGTASAGALVLNNFPEALRKIRTMDDRYLDMAIVDMLRLHERAPELTFNEFLRRVGMAAPKTFLELTDGDAVAAKNISDLYDGNIEDVDLQVGLAAVRKPQGFAISDPAFRVFILMAPRRLKSDRFLSELYKPEVYTQLGIDWIEHNTFMDAAARHYPELRKALEGHDNFFSPWPTTPLRERLYAATAKSSAALLKTAWINAGVGLAAAGAASLLGASWLGALTLALAPAAGAAIALGLILSAMGELGHVTRYAESDLRPELFKPLFRAEATGKRAAAAALFGALTVYELGWLIAWRLLAASPVAAVLIALAATWAGVRALRAARKFKKDLDLLRIGLYGNLNAGRAQRAPETLPGATSLEKHARYFSGGSEVETFSATYRNVRATGQSAFASLTTALSWHLAFARTTQKTMTPKQKALFKPGFFDVFTPNIALTQGAVSSRVFSDGSKPGIARGDIDMVEFDRIFREFAVGRDYLTEYDVVRLQEANWDRDVHRSRLAREIGLFASKKRFKQLFARFADRVVYEDDKDGRLVPAISREQLLYFFSGGLKYDLAENWAR